MAVSSGCGGVTPRKARSTRVVDQTMAGRVASDCFEDWLVAPVVWAEYVARPETAEFATTDLVRWKFWATRALTRTSAIVARIQNARWRSIITEFTAGGAGA